MKRLSVPTLVMAAFALAAAPLFATSATAARQQPKVAQRGRSASQAVRPQPGAIASASYSVQVNIVTRVQGTSFFKTALDISNNTATGTTAVPVTADFQYCYTLGGVYQGCSPPATIALLAFDNFHTDDIVDYLGAQGLISADARASSFGTFIVTFHGLPSGNGWEGTATARTYSAYQDNPSLGTVAIAYPGSLFFESARGSLVGLVRDTRPAPTDAGALRTNLGITNTGLDGQTAPSVTVQLSFYDVTENSATNGTIVGTLTTPSLAPGQVFQFNDVFTSAHIPSTVLSCIVFADILSPTNGSGTIEGYINILSGGTQDGAYFEMKCSTGCPSFN